MSRSIEQHNATLLEELEPGDLVEFKRGVYSHWAVYVGQELVVHLAGTGNDGLNANMNSGSVFTICGKTFSKAEVKTDSFWDVVLGCKAVKNNKKDKKLQPLDRETIVENALEKLGRIGYNVLWNNCEHFASWCRYGSGCSEQANSAMTWTGIALLAAGIAGIFLSSKKGKERQSS